MHANNVSLPGLLLRKAAFDAAADRYFGVDATDAYIAEQLGTDKSTLSQYRNGWRSPSGRFIAAMKRTFSDTPLDDLIGPDDRVAS
jgi:transcriptional regulator with XRE-family HTH domain